MKEQLKQILIALAVILVAGAVLYGGYAWYTRPQTFEAIFPMELEHIDRCEVALHYRGTGEDATWNLTQEQTEQLLAGFTNPCYRSYLSNLVQEASGIRSSLNPSVRLTFFYEDRHVEVLLSEEAILVNPLFGYPGEKSRLYSFTTDQNHQDGILTFLESCLNEANLESNS